MNIKKAMLLFMAITMTGALLAGCSSKGNSVSTENGPSSKYEITQPIKETYFIFDTVVTVKIYDSRATKENFQDIEAILKEIDYKISRNNKDSEISKVNAKSGIAPVQVSQDTFDLVKFAIKYANLSEGLLDPSIGPLVSLWNIGHEGAHVPSAEDIAAMQKLIDFHKIELNEEKQEIYLQDKGMEIDLGSYGKGYAADIVYDYLASKGFNSAIIDLGGNVFAMGQKPGKQDWTIGIQDPAQERGISIGTIKVTDKTVVTSGIYERFFIEDGKLYQHILDPYTGYPVENNISSVTIVTDRSIDADTIDTALVLMGIEKGLKFIENVPGSEIMFITKDKKLYASPGFKEMLNKTNDSYTFAN